MKLEVKETEPGTELDARKITKRWYTEQRGRRLGNTVAWEDLSLFDQEIITTSVEVTLREFEVRMRPEPTPVEERMKNVSS